MNKIKEIIDQFNFDIRGYRKLKNVQIIDTDQGKYVIKRKKTYHDDIYGYLKNKNFNYLLDRKWTQNYEIFPFIEEVSIPREEKAIEMVYILSLLHNKTTFYKEVVLNKIKEIYETLSKEIEYLTYYYHDMQDIIEQKVYMSPGEYLLIRNISLVYSSLEYSKEQLEKWYAIAKDSKRERVVLLHGRPSLDHLLIGKNRTLISWDHSKRGIPIYDFVYFYKSDYLDLEMSALFDMYQSKFLYTQSEYLLFLTMISIPKKLVFTKKHYKDCYEVFKFIRYIEKTRDFVLKKNQETEKSNHNEFDK
ncbi:MAG: hypothetical protein HFJ12_03440 [Bacilli bacterium]|nr:hypothetical protein [Bacilli bacterium]